jgi:hypothetical protein
MLSAHVFVEALAVMSLWSLLFMMAAFTYARAAAPLRPRAVLVLCLVRSRVLALHRHPNYFGDFCVWGFYLMAVSAGPCVMSLLLMRVSGVRLL